MNKKLLFSFLFLIISVVIGALLVGDTPPQENDDEGFINVYGKEPIPVQLCPSEECDVLGIYSKFFSISTTQWYSEDAFIEYPWINQEGEMETGYINKKYLQLEPYTYTQKDIESVEEKHLTTSLDIKEHPWEDSRVLGKTYSEGFFEIPQYVIEQELEYLFINQNIEGDVIEGFIPLRLLEEGRGSISPQSTHTEKNSEPQYEPEIKIQPIIPKESSPGTETTSAIHAPNIKNIEERTIVPEGVVHMVCYFESTHPTTYFRMIFEGSGATIDPAGYILTARHVVDPQYTANENGSLTQEQKDKYSVLELEYCEIGVPSVPETNPAEEILTNMKLPYQYIAHEVINPSSLEGLSEEEVKYLDISILKIDSLNPEFANNYKDLQLPKEFPYNPVLEFTPPSKEGLLSYSYPAYWQTNYRDFINLKRHTATIDQIYFGYKKFSNTPILYSIDVEGAFGSATSFGSSGSPVFWRGYVAGILVSGSSEIDRFFVISPETIKELLKNK